jgi:hypothetical protein
MRREAERDLAARLTREKNPAAHQALDETATVAAPKVRRQDREARRGLAQPVLGDRERDSDLDSPASGDRMSARDRLRAAGLDRPTTRSITGRKGHGTDRRLAARGESHHAEHVAARAKRESDAHSRSLRGAAARQSRSKLGEEPRQGQPEHETWPPAALKAAGRPVLSPRGRDLRLRAQLPGQRKPELGSPPALPAPEPALRISPRLPGGLEPGCDRH